jgi:hypothetical protein
MRGPGYVKKIRTEHVQARAITNVALFDGKTLLPSDFHADGRTASTPVGTLAGSRGALGTRASAGSRTYLVRKTNGRIVTLGADAERAHYFQVLSTHVSRRHMCALTPPQTGRQYA